MEIKKEIIKEKIEEKDYEYFYEIINSKNEKRIKKLLRKLGRLPYDFKDDLFLKLLDHSNNKIRYLAVKNLGKVLKEENLAAVKRAIKKEDNSKTLRELYSTVG